MQASEKELGTTQVLLERFEKQTLPEVLWLKEKVDEGGLLNDGDIDFLKQVFENATAVKTLVDRQPEYQDLFARAVGLYEEIIAKGLENQQAANRSN